MALPKAASRRLWPVIVASLIGMGIAAGTSRAAGTIPPEVVAAQRQEILNRMLTQDAPDDIALQRWVCVMGQEPASVAESRADGAYFSPDAADSCVTALIREGRDGHLLEPYAKLVRQLGGSVQGLEALPRAIGASVTHNGMRVAIGNGKAAEVTPALAFDAGFTVAYQSQAANQQNANARQLKTLAEACLAQKQDVGTCFSAGYLYGTRSGGQPTAAR